MAIKEIISSRQLTSLKIDRKPPRKLQKLFS